MSKTKRFTDVNVDFEESWIRLKDNGDFLIFPISFNDKEEYGLETLEDLLNGLSDKINEQQATITKLKELNDDKGKRIISLIRTNKTLKEENEQLRQSVEYWQKKYEEGTETFQID